MDCERCGARPSTASVERVTPGRVERLRVCEVCLPEIRDETLRELSETVGTPLPSPLGLIPFRPAPHPTLPGCPGCGCTLQDLARSSRAGCPACYETFSLPLVELVRRLHGATRHRGKAPRRP